MFKSNYLKYCLPELKVRNNWLGSVAAAEDNSGCPIAGWDDAADVKGKLHYLYLLVDYTGLDAEEAAH